MNGDENHSSEELRNQSMNTYQAAIDGVTKMIRSFRSSGHLGFVAELYDVADMLDTMDILNDPLNEIQTKLRNAKAVYESIVVRMTT